MKDFKTYFFHFILFAITFVTTTLAGTEWTYGKSIYHITDKGFFVNYDYSWQDFASGLPYSICFLLILTAHEFGHYFVALYYRIKVTLPYFIPLPPGFMLGTMGALIRMKSPVRSTKENFDVGIAGPLAGFIVAIGFLWYGFTHLPPPEYIYQFHPEYQQFGLDYANFVYTSQFMPENTLDVVIGKNLLFTFFENFVGEAARIPNAHELIHYPFLFAGFLSLVFTSLNLMPIGQLDGGHVVYGILGFKWHKVVATVFFIGFLFYAGLGYVSPYQPTKDLVWTIPLFIGFLFIALKGLGFNQRDTLLASLAIFTIQYGIGYWWPTVKGYDGWLLFAFILGRFIGIYHPPSEIETPLNRPRILLGWFAIFVFIICFTPEPIRLIQMMKTAQP